MSKNVAVFVDVANIFYAAKAAGVDIDYVTLLKASTAGRDLVRAYAYTGLDPENENQRQFHAFLGRSGYKVVSKDIRKYGDGRIKANLDIELVVDMMRMATHIDIAVVVSGDGDFAPAIRAVQQLGVRVEVVSFRGNTSSDLIEVADVFTDISQLARVEKGERSGRRVASEDDLSMTAVPEKETDNGVRRRRGEGRRSERPDRPDRPERGERSDQGDRAVRPVRGGRPSTVDAPLAVPGGGTIVVLPGERLSRVAAGVEDIDIEMDIDDEVFGEPAEVLADGDGTAVEVSETEGEARRRRRRRGGRGRGRGRRGEGEFATGEPGEPGGSGELVTAVETRGPRAPREAVDAIDADLIEDEYLETEVATLPQHSTFGSVWESQLGAAPAPAISGLLDDQEGYDDEPEIPEYLLAERRQQGRARSGRDQRPGNRGGAPGNRAGGYRTAVDRERYGRTGSPSAGGYGGGSGGNTSGGNRSDRQPDRNRGGQPGHGGRGQAPARQPRPATAEPRERFERSERPAASAEPWSEVPADVQEMLRAELARKQPESRPQSVSQAPAPEPAPTAPSTGRSRRAPRAAAAAEATPAAAADAVSEAPVKAPAKSRTRAAAVAAPVAGEAPVKAPAKAPARSRTKVAAAEAPAGASADEAPVKAPAKAPARSRTKVAAAEAPAGASADEDPAPKATRRRTTKAAPSGTGEG